MLAGGTGFVPLNKCKYGSIHLKSSSALMNYSPSAPINFLLIEFAQMYFSCN